MSLLSPQSAVAGFDERGAGRYQGLAFSTRAVDRMRAEGGCVAHRRPKRLPISRRFRLGPAGAYPKAE